jgi:hypothetical protein
MIETIEKLDEMIAKIVVDGLIHGTAADASFLKWAAERQGYAKTVEIVEPDVDSPTQKLLARVAADAGHCQKLAESKSERPRARGMSAELARRVLSPEPPLLYNADGYPIRRR